MLLDKQEKSATAKAACTTFPKGIPSGGARNYDSELGIWYGVDPLADKYPGLSPYKYLSEPGFSGLKE
ncbi:MAG: hypothetical protein HYV28_08350 [Ignavibacteriales bacterium]|nr:hypothetical protein [Ignavibacteriales bacterium]